MSPANNIVQVLKERQCAMRREMDRRSIALKAVSFDSTIPYSTLLSYFPEPGGRDPALMPVSAQYMLCGAVPDDILSLLLPEGRLIVQVAEGIDHDQVAKAMVDYLGEKQDAHHPESECGPAIGPTEDSKLKRKLTVITGSKAA